MSKSGKKSKTPAALVSAVTQFARREHAAVTDSSPASPAGAAHASIVPINPIVSPAVSHPPSTDSSSNGVQSPADHPFTIYVSEKESTFLDMAEYELRLKYGIKKYCTRSSMTRFWLTKMKITPELAEEYRQFLVEKNVSKTKVVT